ncbi:hypothetical protein GCM10014715_44350 [Streptomyces spiralis]|uniref:Uncharacterized protein n=1 Tax=Streptomyces spiralis TaxID=66376 RepID=A0A919DVI6_9ACTN|nr:hypothetical protein [Streptomyces spiralis]GHE83656.1 hypothetical protein GCM10014715_44350 [Streptomyces spiralis]
MGMQTDWAYRVDEPHGSAGWRPYGDPQQWRGTITTDEPTKDAEYVAALVVRDLADDWTANGHMKHVRVIVWEDGEGTGLEDAACVLEVQPDLDAK